MDMVEEIYIGCNCYAHTVAAIALAYLGFGYRNVRLCVGSKKPAMRSVKDNAMVTEQTEDDVKLLFHFDPSTLEPRWNIAWWLTDEQLYLDLDRDHAGGKDGIATLLDYEAEHGALPDTWRVHTPRGGIHLPYQDPHHLLEEAGLVTNKTGCAVNGIDYRGPGKGMEVVPSTHIEDVGDYLWDDERNPWSMPCGIVDERVVDFVKWHCDQVDDATRKSRAVKPSAQALWNHAGVSIDSDRAIPVGERNDMLFRMLCSARARGAGDGEVDDLAREINETLMEEPLDDAEVDGVVASACCYEQGEDYGAMADRLFSGQVAKGGPYAPTIID